MLLRDKLFSFFCDNDDDCVPPVLDEKTRPFDKGALSCSWVVIRLSFFDTDEPFLFHLGSLSLLGVVIRLSFFDNKELSVFHTELLSLSGVVIRLSLSRPSFLLE